jgi:S1-C subfamily serine protease
VASGPEKEAARVAGLVLGPVPEAVRAQTRLGRGEGVLVEEIDEKSRGRPDMAPLRRFDVVTRVADRPVGSAGDFVKALNELEPGEKFFYRLLRGGVTLIVPARK